MSVEEKGEEERLSETSVEEKGEEERLDEIVNKNISHGHLSEMNSKR